jgi:chromate transport protein ChrA
MGRQILAVIVGLALNFQAMAAAGFLLHHLSGWSESQQGAPARYALNPLIAIVVGACVGALAKSRPGTLATLSLAPGAIATLFFRRQSAAHELILLLSSFLCLLLGALAAKLVFRMRVGKKQVI